MKICNNMLQFLLYKKRTADELRINDWSSDVCSSDLLRGANELGVVMRAAGEKLQYVLCAEDGVQVRLGIARNGRKVHRTSGPQQPGACADRACRIGGVGRASCRQRVWPDVCISLVAVYVKNTNMTRRNNK